MKDDVYFALDHLRYSKMSRFDREGPRSLINTEDISGKSQVRLGSLVDDMITNVDDLEDKYYKVELKKPTASLGLLFDKMVKKYKEDEINLTVVLKEARKMKLWRSVSKEDTYISKFNTRPFWDYIKFHFESEGKVLIDIETWLLAEQMTATLLNDKDTKETFEEQPHIENKYQEVMIWDNPDRELIGGGSMGDKFVCKFDVLRVNHLEKTLQFVDIKTMGAPITEFETSFYRFRYYIQDALYQDGLKALRDKEYPEFTLLEPYNVVISSQEPEKAYRFDIATDWLVAGKHGYLNHGTQKKGYKQLANEMCWHYRNGEYDYTREETRNGRRKTIKFKGTL